jgi:hypothetical protein
MASEIGLGIKKIPLSSLFSIFLYGLTVKFSDFKCFRHCAKDGADIRELESA